MHLRGDITTARSGRAEIIWGGWNARPLHTGGPMTRRKLLDSTSKITRPQTLCPSHVGRHELLIWGYFISGDGIIYDRYWHHEQRPGPTTGNTRRGLDRFEMIIWSIHASTVALQPMRYVATVHHGAPTVSQYSRWTAGMIISEPVQPRRVLR